MTDPVPNPVLTPSPVDVQGDPVPPSPPFGDGVANHPVPRPRPEGDLNTMNNPTSPTPKNAAGQSAGHTCEVCASWLSRRRRILLPAVGRWVTQGDRDRRPATIVRQLLDEHHARTCEAKQ